MQQKLYIIMLTGIVLLMSTTASNVTAEEEIVARVFSSKTGATMPYRVLKPADYNPSEKYPLVVCLHGAAGRGTDNKSRRVEAFKALSSPDIQKEYPSFLVTPQNPKGVRWVSRLPDSRDRYIDIVLEILDTLQTEFSVDPSRIYITGQSQGGRGTWAAVLTKPNLFAAAVPICGRVDHSGAKKIAHMPIWVFHGGDDQAIPTQISRDMVAALKREGSSVIYTEYPGVGHDAWVPAWKEKDLIPWLFKQRKAR